MELSDYLRIVKRRLWILILVPVVAAGAIAALVLAQPTQYSATATVAAPALIGGTASNQYSGSTGTKAFVANFSATAVSNVITNKVASETHANKSDITAGTSVTPVGQSSVVQLKYTTSHKALASPVAKAEASETMLFLFSTQKDLAAEQSAQAQQALTTAENDLTAFENKNGVQLDQTYSSDQQLYNSYLQQAASAQSSGNVSAAAFYNSKAAQVRQQLAQLAPLVIQFQGLQAKVTQAQSQLQTADTTLQSAEAQYAAADPSHTVTVSTTQQESLLPTLVKEAAPAFGAGLFLAVVIVALLELVARRPRQAEPGVSAAKRQPVSMES